MSFLTGYMEVMLAAATDPQEIELRRQVLDDQRAMQAELREKAAEAAAILGEPTE